MNGLHRYCEIQAAIQVAAHEVTINGKTFEGENFRGQREKQKFSQQHACVLLLMINEVDMEWF